MVAVLSMDPRIHALFILDEVVFRRIVWQGGGGYLAVQELPSRRWCLFGPWELTLGARLRYERRGNRSGADFWKGKLLLDLAGAACEAPMFSVSALLGVVTRSRQSLERVPTVTVGHGQVPRIG